LTSTVYYTILTYVKPDKGIFLAMTEKKLMSVEQVAEYLQVHKQTVRRWIHRGELPAARAGRQFRIYPEDVERFTTTLRPAFTLEPTRRLKPSGHPVLVDGHKLKRARQESGTTVRELARRAGVSESWIYSMQRAPNRGIYSTTTTVEDIAEALGVEPAELLREG
jgi:excisionase family DNA binding protein